jgi:hypothetical protein
MKPIQSLFSRVGVLLAVLPVMSVVGVVSTPSSAFAATSGPGASGGSGTSGAAPAETASLSVLPDDGGSRFELSALSNGGFFFNGSGSLGFVAVGAAIQIVPSLQLAVDAAYLNLHAFGESTWAIGALVGPVLNFPFKSDLRDAFFVSAKYGGGVLGGTEITSGTDNSKGVLDFSIGKRFKITEHISYTPEFGFSDVLGGGNSTYSDATQSYTSSSATAFRVVLFAFSAFF